MGTTVPAARHVETGLTVPPALACIVSKYSVLKLAVYVMSAFGLTEWDWAPPSLHDVHV
jgi:hypothetical protein